MKLNAIPALLVGLGLSATASAQLDLGTLPDGFTAGYFTYGNANVYSLPVNNYVHDYYFGGGTGPGSAYYVVSTPGAIKDTVVIYTGSDGQGVTTNVTGFENSYTSPSGSQPIYADMAPTNMGVPTPAKASPEITTLYSYSWDADVQALKSFLDGGLATFLFNNNDTRGDENLALWAKLWITDPNGNAVTFGNGGAYIYANRSPVAPYGTPGIPSGNASTLLPQNLDPTINADGTTDWAMSGGDVCIDNTAGPAVPPLYPAGTPAIVPCGSAGVDEVIKHNLGANQVAYAAQFPLLDAKLASLGAAVGYTFHLDLRLGCDPDWETITGKTCDQLGIDNGFEQLFLISTKTPTLVPEPASLALLGLGLLGLGLGRRRTAA